MLKKMIFKLLGIAFILFALSTYAGYLLTGQLSPLLRKPTGSFGEIARTVSNRLPHFDRSAFESLKTRSGNALPILEGNKNIVYKWRNEKGGWEYSNRRPPENIRAEKLEIHTDNNIVASPIAAASSETQSQPQPEVVRTDDPTLVNPYSPEGVQKIIEQAKEAKKAMEQHSGQQQDILKKL